MPEQRTIAEYLEDVSDAELATWDTARLAFWLDQVGERLELVTAHDHRLWPRYAAQQDRLGLALAKAHVEEEPPA